MTIEYRPAPAGNQIRTLIFVILSAVACAFLISGLLLYRYGPSGGYSAKNAILSPDVTESLWYSDANPKTGGSSRFVFDDLVFSYFDTKTRQQHSIQITPELYRQFYQIVANDTSIAEITPQLLTHFDDGSQTSLVLNVRTESNAGWQEDVKTLQQIDFAKEGNYYRVDLREENAPNQWAYFYHPQIYQKTIHLFISS